MNPLIHLVDSHESQQLIVDTFALLQLIEGHSDTHTHTPAFYEDRRNTQPLMGVEVMRIMLALADDWWRTSKENPM